MARLFIMSQQVRTRWEDVLDSDEAVQAASAEVELLELEWVKAGGLPDALVHEYKTAQDHLTDAQRERSGCIEWLLAVGGRLDDWDAVAEGREIVWDEMAPGPCH